MNTTTSALTAAYMETCKDKAPDHNEIGLPYFCAGWTAGIKHGALALAAPAPQQVPDMQTDDAIAVLQNDALIIFGGTEASQPVRDVIEWFCASLTVRVAPKPTAAPVDAEAPTMVEPENPDVRAMFTSAMKEIKDAKKVLFAAGCHQDKLATMLTEYVTLERRRRRSSALKPLDDQRLQVVFGEAIEGAIAFGAMNNNVPPAGHWLQKFWDIGRAQGIQLVEASPSKDDVDREDRAVRVAFESTNDSAVKPMYEYWFRKGFRWGRPSATSQAAPVAPQEPKVANYNTSDHNLTLLLELTDDMATGKANMDTGMWWLETLQGIQRRLAKSPDVDEAALTAAKPERTGPGTPSSRFHLLMTKLHERFPDPDPYSSATPPETVLLRQIDAMIASKAPQPEPITDAQILENWRKVGGRLWSEVSEAEVQKFARAIWALQAGGKAS